jgi:hypothetical protein
MQRIRQRRRSDGDVPDELENGRFAARAFCYSKPESNTFADGTDFEPEPGPERDTDAESDRRAERDADADCNFDTDPRTEPHPNSRSGQ